MTNRRRGRATFERNPSSFRLPFILLATERRRPACSLAFGFCGLGRRLRGRLRGDGLLPARGEASCGERGGHVRIHASLFSFLFFMSYDTCLVCFRKKAAVKKEMKAVTQAPMQV